MIQQQWQRWQLRRLRQRTLPAPLSDYLRHWPLLAQPLEQLELMAIDIETTGLNPRRDAIVSVGLVPIRALRIELGDAHHQLIAAEQEVGQSATCHQLTDTQLRQGLPLTQFSQWLLPHLQGQVLVAHFASIEAQFIGQRLKRDYGVLAPLPFIDTLALQQRLLARANVDLPAHNLRLGQCRARYQLPPHRGHNALSDALACAELLLAQLQQFSPLPRATDLIYA